MMYTSTVHVHFHEKTVCPPPNFSFLQGRHVKTGQLAAIKVMDVTGVRHTHTHIHVLTLALTHTHARTYPQQIISSDYTTVDHVI